MHQVTRRVLNITFFISLFFILSACKPSASIPVEKKQVRNFDVSVGTKFNRIPLDIFELPIVEEVPFEFLDSVDAIWGATGRDDRGNIYFGASSHGGDKRSAYLYKYDPMKDETSYLGDVMSQLRQAGLYQEGMGQNKLHSKFYQADDEYIYFSSFDEEGEADGINPKWGGHLWRISPISNKWEHLLATDEALIAINTHSDYVYALGYWGHVLFQYHTKTNQVKKVTVGSLGRHISRNFIVDGNNHIYVPYVRENQFNEVEAYLNEYDSSLSLINSHPMPEYGSDNLNENHGIVGYTSLENNKIVFTTDRGGLYEIDSKLSGDEKVIYRGKMHAEGSAYIPSLFTFEGKDFVVGIGRRDKKAYEWIVYDLTSGLSVNKKLDLSMLNKPLIYGSLTKDDFGEFYVGGWSKVLNTTEYRPVFLKVSLQSDNLTSN